MKYPKQIKRITRVHVSKKWKWNSLKKNDDNIKAPPVAQTEEDYFLSIDYLCLKVAMSGKLEKHHEVCTTINIHFEFNTFY